MSQGSFDVQISFLRYVPIPSSNSTARSDPLMYENAPIRPFPASPPQTSLQQATDAGTSNPAGHAHGSTEHLLCSSQHPHPVVVPFAQVHW